MKTFKGPVIVGLFLTDCEKYKINALTVWCGRNIFSPQSFGRHSNSMFTINVINKIKQNVIQILRLTFRIEFQRPCVKK